MRAYAHGADRCAVLIVVPLRFLPPFFTVVLLVKLVDFQFNSVEYFLRRFGMIAKLKRSG